MKSLSFAMTIIAACLAMAFTNSAVVVAQDKTAAPKAASPLDAVIVTEAAERSFHRSVIKTAVAMQKAGSLSRGDLVRLRVAMLSPAFRRQAEELAIVQMAASGSDNVPIGEDGQIDRASIDWDALFAFIEKLIPIILQLIEIFGGVTAMDLHTLPDGTMYAMVSFESGCLLTLGV